MTIIIMLISIFVFTFVGIYFFKKFAYKLNLIDIPNDRSMHQKNIPRGAGIIFILSPILILALFNFHHVMMNYYIYLAILIVLVVGIWDDIKNVSPKIKFLFLFFATLILYVNNFAIYSIGTYFGYEIIFPGWLVLPFTFFALAGYTNALNLMDGLDGLAASLSLVMLIAFFIIGVQHQDKLLILLSSSYIISLLAFLLFNWHPAKVFMGDSGSLALGIIIVILALQSLHYIRPVSVLFVIALPILDTFIVMTRRIQRHQSPFRADKNHLHHLLFNVKGDIRYTVIMLTMMQMVFSIIGYQVKQSDDLISLILFGLLFYIYLNLFDQRLKRRNKTDEEADIK